MHSEWKWERSESGRCCNVDWLEVYCQEDNDRYPMNADYYREHGFFVRERDYGTRQYNEMFTLLDDHDEPFVEIRRNPVSGASSASQLGIFNPLSCHIRLSNRYCYHPQVIQVFTDFLHAHNYTIKNIFRLDLCLDFTRFDGGDNPHDFLVRYLKGRYSKINQGRIATHGVDRWDGREWNSVSWGSPTSMVSTKFYCKSLELEEAKDKPYIRYAWQVAGLVDDYVHLTKLQDDGTLKQQDVWRVEFSIRSSARHWLAIEDNSGRKTKVVRKLHELGCYATAEQRLEAFAMLAHHYFHFKYYEPEVRKDRCRDKVLFRFNLDHKPYVLDRLLTSRPKETAVESLIKRLHTFRIVHPETSLRNACDVLLDALEQLQVRNTIPSYGSLNEARLLQALIAERLHASSDETLDETKKRLQSYFDISSSLY